MKKDVYRRKCSCCNVEYTIVKKDYYHKEVVFTRETRPGLFVKCPLCEYEEFLRYIKENE